MIFMVTFSLTLQEDCRIDSKHSQELQEKLSEILEICCQPIVVFELHNNGKAHSTSMYTSSCHFPS